MHSRLAVAARGVWQSRLVHINSHRWLVIGVGAPRIVVSVDDPCAVIRLPGQSDVVASWPDLDVGVRATSSTVMGAPTGAWVFYRPLEADDSAIPEGTPAAVHIGVDGDVTRFTGLTEHQPLGVTRHGLWLTPDSFPDPNSEAAWRGDHHATVLSPDGTARGITLDRRIAFALDDGRRSRLILYRDAPTATRGRLGGTTYTYRYIGVALTDELVIVPHVADCEPEPFDEHELLDAMEQMAPQPPDDPPFDPDTPWKMINLSEDDKDAAVRSVLREFDHLANYWRAPDGRTSPLSHGLGDPRVEAVDEWPTTRVEVSFTHPHYPEGRLRRSLHVFDDAGRIRPAMYASIHLMEDLETAALPDTSRAQDGILEI